MSRRLADQKSLPSEALVFSVESPPMSSRAFVGLSVGILFLIALSEISCAVYEFPRRAFAPLALSPIEFNYEPLFPK